MICRYLVTSASFSDCIALRFRVGEVFRCEVTADGSNGKSRCAFQRWLRLWASTFLSCLKNGYPGCSHRLHSCLMFPRVRSVYLHEKRFSRPRSLKELHKKGKEPAF